MLKKITRKTSFILNNDNGDIPAATIGFIFVGLLVIGIALVFRDNIRGFFERAGQTVDSWDTSSANG